MKKTLSLLITVVVLSILAIFTLNAQYQNSEDKYLHSFTGPIDLRVMRFGQQLSMDFIGPTANLLGYAHRPASARDKQMVDEFYLKMQEYFRFINISQDGQCRFNELDLDNPFFALYMNTEEAEYINKFDEERGNLNTINRGVQKRYNSSPQQNSALPTRSKMNRANTLNLNPYYFSSQNLANPFNKLVKYQSVTVDREQLNRSRFYVNDKRLSENELRERQNFEYIYDLGKEQPANTSRSTSTPALVPQTRPNSTEQYNSYNADFNYNQNYVPAPVPPADNFNNDVVIPQENYDYNQNRDNYKIAKKGLNSGSYQQPQQTETDISVRFSCNAGENLSYVDLREFFDTFPYINLIYAQVITEDGQYNIKIDKRNSTIYLR